MSTAVTLSFTENSAVATITLDGAAQRNALDATALAALADVIAEVTVSPARAVVLRGEGKVFCAGRDISQVVVENDDALEFLQHSVDPVILGLRALEVPTLCAVQGAALGIGLGLALACDVIYTAADAKFGSPFAAIGALLDSGGHKLLIDRLGFHRAMDLIYTGDFISGTEAAAAGLVSRAVAGETLHEFTATQAARIASGPTQAFKLSKQIALAVEDSNISLPQVLALEAPAQEAARQTADYREGFTSFQQKRRPTFTGA